MERRPPNPNKATMKIDTRWDARGPSIDIGKVPRIVMPGDELAALYLPEQDRQVLTFINGHTTVSQIIIATQIPPDELRAILVRLQDLEVITM